MTHTEIATFVAVVQLKSFLSAARVLNVSQSTVSQRVAGLERSLGKVLFDRSTRSVELSLAGSRFMPHALRLLDAHADALASVAATQSTALKGHILPTIDPRPVQRAIVSLLQASPSLHIDIQTSTGHEAIQGIQNRLLDFALLPPPDIIGVRLRSTTMLSIKEEVLPFVSPLHDLAKRRKLTLGQLTQHRVPVAHLTLWWKRPRQLTQLLKAASTSSEMPVEVGVSWCQEGHGIMFLNAGYARRFVESGTLKPLVITDMPKTYRLMNLVKPRTAPVSTMLDDFCAVFAKEIAGDGVDVIRS
jgi:DNA-binding transcriptional LysR family regulator